MKAGVSKTVGTWSQYAYRGVLIRRNARLRSGQWGRWQASVGDVRLRAGTLERLAQDIDAALGTTVAL